MEEKMGFDKGHFKKDILGIAAKAAPRTLTICRHNLENNLSKVQDNKDELDKDRYKLIVARLLDLIKLIDDNDMADAEKVKKLKNDLRLFNNII